jgi:[acyl-carrier-protein] S-malonyltransferase
MKKTGAEVILEAGPGKVLAGLVKRIDKSLTGVAVLDLKSIDAAKEILQ